MSVGEFFAVEGQTWGKVCDLGLGSAVAYLVLARGSERDHRTSSWSVNAIERYTGVARGRARAALSTLQGAGLLVVDQGGTRPRYRLQTAHEGPEGTTLAPAWIWLPNAIIDGAAAERPPVKLIREMQDVGILRLFVDLYGAHHLRDDGGVDRRVVWQAWDRVPVGDFGEYKVYGFTPGQHFVTWGQPWVDVHQRTALTPAERKARKNPAVDFFARLSALVDTGLVEWVPHLYDGTGPDAEVIHVYGLTPGRPERAVTDAAHAAALTMLTGKQRRWVQEQEPPIWLVPVPRHFAHAALIGIARLRYRPHTRATGAWWASYQTNLSSYLDAYTRLAERAAESMGAVAVG